MKNYNYSIITLAALICAASCSKQEIPSMPKRETVRIEVNASAEETKATIGGMAWEAGDAINVFVASHSGEAGYAGDVLPITNVANGTFCGEVSVPQDTDTYYSTYNAVSVGQNGSATFEIPAVQSGTGDLKVPMAAVAENVGIDNIFLAFKPVAALLELNVADGLKEVVFESLDASEGIFGNFTWDPTNAAVDYASLDAGAITVTSATSLTCVKILVPAKNFASGYKLTLKNDSGTMIQSVGANGGVDFSATNHRTITLAAGKFVPVAAIIDGPRTNYNYATEGNISKANSMETHVLDLGSIKIQGLSSTFLGDVTYGYSIDGGSNITVGNMSGASNKTVTLGTQTLSGMGRHNATVWAKYDGIEIGSVTREVWVTGIPYSAASQSAFKVWEMSKSSWNSGGYVRLGDLSGGTPYISYNNFSLPSDVNIVVHSKYAAGFASVSTNFSIHVSGTRILNFAGKGGVANTSGNSGESDNNGTLTAANPTIRCESSYNLGNTHSRLYNISVKYR